MFEILLWIAILGGILHGLLQVHSVKQNPSLGSPSSKNIFTYLFCDKY